MAIELIDKIKPKNGGSFPMVDAEDVLMPNGQRLSEYRQEEAQELPAVSAADNGKYLRVASGKWAAGNLPTDLATQSFVQTYVAQNVPAGVATETYVQQYVDGKVPQDVATETYVQTYVTEKLSGGASETVILEEQDFTSTLDSTYGYFNTAQPSAAFAVGQTYKVVLDGVEHTCEGVDASAFMAGGVFFGNGKNFGFPDTGEPFAAIFTPQNNVVSIMYLNDTAPTAHNVAIYHVTGDAIATESFVKGYVEQYISEALGGDY